MLLHNNTFEFYSSKIKPIFIPILNSGGKKKSGNIEKDDFFFLGRRDLINKLKNWLCKDDTGNGVYLVSGYRGMGKTSYVNRVLSEINCDAFLPGKNVPSSIFLSMLYALLYLLYINNFLTLFFFNYHPFNISPTFNKVVLYFSFFVTLAFFVISQIKSGYCFRKRNRISIKLNLGHEVSNEKDVLALISKMLQKKYTEYKNNLHYTRPLYGVISLVFKSFVSVLLFFFCYQTFSYIINIFNYHCYSNLFREIIINEIFFYVILTVLFLCLYPLVSKIGSWILSCFSTFFPFFNSLPIIVAKDLSILNDRINSTVFDEKSASMEYKAVRFGKSEKKVYPLAGIREVEQELITILANIKRFPSAPCFIIVLDELDKMDESLQAEGSEKEIFPEYESLVSGFPGSMSSRKRKQSVLNLLANLKFFTSTAQAKFIFISGRELYDASLTDVSDRQFAISSIFNGVIYVDSFLSSENNKKEISSMSETYICHHLIPESYVVNSNCNFKNYKKCKEYFSCHESCTHYPKSIDDNLYSLKVYRTYLQKLYEDNNHIQLGNAIIDKTILILYHFSVYLAHVSNGAPQKIATHFDKYVKLYRDDKEKNILLIKGRNSKDKHTEYLAFGYRDQQKINFIHYMSYPVMQAVINSSGNFGDKLLLSASFLTDHIYKHHKDGFSWRNIELVPELLDENKTPELRSFINSIISFLKQTHLSAIYSGVYTLKFPKKISEEISYFSKLSEEVSSMFNFTQDETLSVKKYYIKMLNFYQELPASFNNQTANNFFLHTQKIGKYSNTDSKKTNVKWDEMDLPEKASESCISDQSIFASIHHILGDLYMSEENYSNAILEYKKCASNLPIGKEILDHISPSNLLYYIRNILKLGMAYEKRKTYDSAYFVYEELSSLLMKYRYFNEEKYGMEYKNGIITKRKEDREDKKNNKNLKEDGGNVIDKDQVFKYLIQNWLPEAGSVIAKLALFEDVRFVYQVLLSKLLLAEKMEFGGITHAEMDETVEEFEFLSRFVNQKEKFSITANFFREMGDIMYYKNGFLVYKISNGEGKGDEYELKAWDLWSYRLKNTIEEYIKQQNSESEQYKVEVLQNELTDFFSTISEKKLVEAIEKKDPTILFESKQLEQFFKLSRKVNSDELRYHIVKIIDPIINKNKYSENNGGDYIIYQKVVGCNKRRENCTYNKNYYPCFACKFYNESLRILIKNVYDTSTTEDQRTKVIVLWNHLLKAKTTPREDTLILIATILSSFGNVLLSCSDNCDPISKKFLVRFFKAVELSQTIGIGEKKEGGQDLIIDIFDEMGSLSFVEKSILYFWTASEYFSSSNSKEASYCHKKILLIFLNYYKVHGYGCVSENQLDAPEGIEKKELLDNIKTYIVDRSIRYLYSQYEKINIAEIQRLKWMYSKKMYKDITLSSLSLFPDIEGILYSYLELYLLLNKNEKLYYEKTFAEHYGNLLFSSFRIDSTVSEKVHSLNLKVQFNKRLLFIMFPKIYANSCNLESNFSSYLAPYAFFLSFKHYMSDETDILEIIRRAGLTDHYNKTKDNKSSEILKIELLLFLLHDSLFCLSKIIEETTSNHDSTLFSHSFIAECYRELFDWNEIFEFLYDILKISKAKKTNANDCIEIEYAIMKDLYHFSKHRYFDYSKVSAYHSINTLMEEHRLEQDSLYSRFFIEIGAQDCCAILMQAFNKRQFDEFMFWFEAEIKTNASESRVNFLSTNYCAEMAINQFRSCKELHSEGKTYKESISNMYLQNDDLNNDTCQFQYAVERYMINCGYIEKNINELKKIFWNSNLYDVNNYIKPC